MRPSRAFPIGRLDAQIDQFISWQVLSHLKSWLARCFGGRRDQRVNFLQYAGHRCVGLYPPCILCLATSTIP